MKKRILTSVLSAALALSMSMPAFATTMSQEVTSIDVAGVDVSADGTVTYQDLTKISVILPTNNALGFSLDPQGLLSVTASGVLMSELEDVAGKIIPAATPQFINNSTFPIALGVDLKVDITTAMNHTTSGAVLTGAGVTSTTINNPNYAGTPENTVQLFAIPAAYNTPAVSTIGSDFTAAQSALLLNATNTILTYALDEADYMVTPGTGGAYIQTLQAGTGTGGAFALGGFINKYADWSAYTGSSASNVITLKATFKVTDNSAKAGTYTAPTAFLTAPAIENVLASASLIGSASAAAGTVVVPITGSTLPKATTTITEWSTTTVPVAIAHGTGDFLTKTIEKENITLTGTLNAATAASLGMSDPKFSGLPANLEMFATMITFGTNNTPVSITKDFLDCLEPGTALTVTVTLDGFDYPVGVKIPGKAPTV